MTSRGTHAITFTLLGVGVAGVVICLLLLWLIPLLVQRRRSYAKKRDLQKKVTEELVFNCRYKSPSIVALNQQGAVQMRKDYGSTTNRDLDSEVNDCQVTSPSVTMTPTTTTEVPSINITFDECTSGNNGDMDSLLPRSNSGSSSQQHQQQQQPELWEQRRNSGWNNFGSDDCNLNKQRRFSSIVFSHSDELKVLSGNGSGSTDCGSSLSGTVAGERERRASMSLFDTCKLACPELGQQDLGRSTEHLNKLALQELPPGSSQAGRLYFSIAQVTGDDGDGHTLHLSVIKVTDVVQKRSRQPHFVELMLLAGGDSNSANEEGESNGELCRIFGARTQTQLCGGEVVNFDESFDINIAESVLPHNHQHPQNPKQDSNSLQQQHQQQSLILVFELWQSETKKTKVGTASANKIGEIRFDLLGLIEGQILRVDGQEKFVVCRSFMTLSDKDRIIENTGKILILLRFLKVSPMNLVIGIVSAKDIKSNKPYTGINIRVTLATEKKVLDSRKSRVIKKKSQDSGGVMKIDESFEFNLSSSTGDSHSSESLFVTVFLCGRTSIGFSHVLGKCVLGPIQYADGLGLLHWTVAMSKLGTIEQRWHILRKT